MKRQKFNFSLFIFEKFSLITMESRIKTLKILKLSKKQLNYQNNLALITNTSFLNSFPPNQAEHCPQCDKNNWKIGRKWYLLSDMKSFCGSDGSAASSIGGSGWGGNGMLRSWCNAEMMLDLPQDGSVLGLSSWFYN